MCIVSTFRFLKTKNTHTHTLFRTPSHKKLLQTPLKNHHTCSWFHCFNATPFELFEPTQLGNSKRWLSIKKQTYPTLATDSVISAMVHELGCQFHCIQTKFVASQQSTGYSMTWWISLWLHHESQKTPVSAAFRVILNSCPPFQAYSFSKPKANHDSPMGTKILRK